METVEKHIFDSFASIFENRLFPEIAPQDFQNEENIVCPFCVYSINNIEKQTANCGEPDIYSIQFSIYEKDYDKLKELRDVFIQAADKLAKRVNVSQNFFADLKTYQLICEYDFYFSSM